MKVVQYAHILSMTAPTVITVETIVQAPIDTVWSCWNEPKHIIKWNAASNDWHTPRAAVDLKVGGKFSARMEAKDGSMGFDFEGVYTAVEPKTKIGYTIADGRTVEILFQAEGEGVRVTETFQAENENPIELQRSGWQAILDNFKRYTEAQM